jgi:hypothetical protein
MEQKRADGFGPDLARLRVDAILLAMNGGNSAKGEAVPVMGMEGRGNVIGHTDGG